jgi:hypothetical protein
MHRSLSIEAKLSSPTKRFSFVGWSSQVSIHSRPRARERLFGPSPREGSRIVNGSSVGSQQAAPANLSSRNDFSLRRPCHP